MERLIAEGDLITVGLTPPAVGIGATTSLGVIINNIFIIIFIVAALAVLFMLVIGAFQWIMSGGDKEAVGNARKRITNALIGLAILALAFFIITIIGRILNFDIFGQINLGIPSLDNTTRPTATPRAT